MRRDIVLGHDQHGPITIPLVGARVALQGPPASGKTTLCRRIVLATLASGVNPSEIGVLTKQPWQFADIAELTVHEAALPTHPCRLVVIDEADFFSVPEVVAALSGDHGSAVVSGFGKHTAWLPLEGFTVYQPTRTLPNPSGYVPGIGGRGKSSLGKATSPPAAAAASSMARCNRLGVYVGRTAPWLGGEPVHLDAALPPRLDPLHNPARPRKLTDRHDQWSHSDQSAILVNPGRVASPEHVPGRDTGPTASSGANQR